MDLQDGAACGEGDKLGDGGVVAEADPAGVIIHCAQPGQKKDQADGDPEASDKIPFVFFFFFSFLSVADCCSPQIQK